MPSTRRAADNNFAEIVMQHLSDISDRIGRLEARATTSSDSTMSDGVMIGNRSDAPMNEELVQTEEQPIHYFQTPDKPFFSNKTGENPIRFLKKLDSYVVKMAKRNKRLEVARECLDEDARRVLEINADDWKSYEDFKRDFLTTFWGDAKQNEVLSRMTHGSWDKSKGSMLSYFAQIVDDVKMLTEKPLEKTIVREVMQQFPEDIQRLWFQRRENTIREASEFLRSLDCNVQRKKMQEGAGSSTQTTAVQQPRKFVYPVKPRERLVQNITVNRRGKQRVGQRNEARSRPGVGWRRGSYNKQRWNYPKRVPTENKLTPKEPEAKDAVVEEGTKN